MLIGANRYIKIIINIMSSSEVNIIEKYNYIYW